MKNENWIDELKDVSPLDMPQFIKECEFYSKTDAEEVMKQVNKEFRTGEDTARSLIFPIFMNLIAGFGREYKIKGLGKVAVAGNNGPRLYEEFKNFSYENDEEFQNHINIKIEAKERELGKYNRKDYEINGATSKYKNKRQKEAGGNKTFEDDFESKRLYYKDKDADARNFNKASEHKTQVDHVVPLRRKFEELENNSALSERDKKEICNMDENFQLISQKLNTSKGKKTNLDLIEENKLKGNLDKSAEEKLRENHNRATKAMDMEQNKRVIKNIKTKEGIKNVGSDYANHELVNDISGASGQVLADAVIECSKAGFYEIRDSIENGVKYKINNTTKIAAFGYRIKRVFTYVLYKFKDILSTNIFSLLKNIAKSLLGFIVNLFAGLVKSIGKIIVNGITSIVEAVKIMLKPSSEMSLAQKGDAIVKILVSASTVFLGEGIELLLSKIGIPEDIRKVLKIVIESLLAIMLVYLLDKLDIFGAKEERRLERIKEIYQLREEEIIDNQELFINNISKVLDEQKKSFIEIKDTVLEAIKNDDSEKLVEGSFSMANHLGVELEYSNTDEFLNFLNS